ncbi:ABC transporter permease [Corynebacterium marambiense]|uniref:ABC transporter permease n=1 Tax=Corynebacterium marambiense TaxID=2765364 RepID=UPI00396A8903
MGYGCPHFSEYVSHDKEGTHMSSKHQRRNKRGKNRPGMIPAEVFAPLKAVTGRPPLNIYLHELWQRRFFIRAEARAKAFSGTRNLLLGKLWLLLSPLLDTLIYGIIFGIILKTSHGVDHFVLFLIIGVVLFRLISKDLTDGSGIIRARKNVIKAFSFPRASLILSNSLKSLYDSVPPLLVLFAVIYFYPDGPDPTLTWLAFPLLFIVIKLFGAGLTFFAAWCTHLVPDLSRIIQVFTRFWFYGSGVFFSIDRFVDQPTLLRAMQLNPAYQMLTAGRDLLIYNSLPNTSTSALLLCWSITTFIVGFLLFWSAETRYAKF